MILFPYMKTSVFHARIQVLRRVTIPKPICDALDLKKGDKVEIIVKKVE